MDEHRRSAAAGLAGRSAHQVLDDHLALRECGDLEEDLRRNYHPGVVILTPTASGFGHDGVRECTGFLYQAIECSGEFECSGVACDERMALLEWSAAGAGLRIDDGVDTFLIEAGLIRVQTVRFTVVLPDSELADALPGF